MSADRRVLITGGGGQLATDLRTVFTGPATALVDRAQLDVCDRAAVLAAVRELKPEIIVNAAAYTAVDLCETEVDTAHAVNSLAPSYLVEAAEEVEARVVQVSTDYVFDGGLDRPYHEWDAANPMSVYGRSKFGGELAMRRCDLIVRTSWLCGPHGNNILKTIARLALNEQDMKFVDDQIGHPSFTGDVAAVIGRLVEADAHGTFHVTNQGAVSWYDFVTEILVALGRPASQVTAISTEQLDPPRPAPRPANSVLDNMALRLWGVRGAPDFRESLSSVLDQIVT
ncbi:MAG: dTDP-4-dehydrorhamnose reductase [Actinomycetota bacterium]|jgi:dTDP-4-dehydrorhamnose reductase|nr:dTDP-4-dehydrorhamnose reductase [Actinomycetota bacterium]